MYCNKKIELHRRYSIMKTTFWFRVIIILKRVISFAKLHTTTDAGAGRRYVSILPKS